MAREIVIVYEIIYRCIKSMHELSDLQNEFHKLNMANKDLQTQLDKKNKKIELLKKEKMLLNRQHKRLSIKYDKIIKYQQQHVICVHIFF